MTAVVGRGVAVERGEGADGNSEEQREYQGRTAQLQRYRKAETDQLGDREVLVFERRSKIPVRQRAQVPGVLRPNGLIEPVGRLQIRHDLRRQGLLLIERAARGCVDQEKRQRDNAKSVGIAPANRLRK